MKKTFNYFRTMAALLFAGATIFSCTLNEEPFNEPESVVDGPKVYTLTITAGNAATKALNVDDVTGRLSATWGAGDKIQVVKGSSSLGFLDVQTISNDGKTATFSGSLSEAVAANDELVLWYNNKGYNAFKEQDGTLASAAEHDCAKATVTVESIDDYTGHVTLKEGTAIFETQTAVLKLKLTTDGTNELNARELTLTGSFTVPYQSSSIPISHEIYSFNIPDATYDDNGDGVLYFALPDRDALAEKVYNTKISLPAPFSGEVAIGQLLTKEEVKERLATATITVKATLLGWSYSCNVSGYLFVKNKYYTANLTLSNF